MSGTTYTLVTGANRGIGLAAAQRLAKEHGHHVIIGSRNFEAGAKVAEALKAEGFAASNVQLDLNSQASVLAAAAYIEQTFGRLDVLVNNAAILIDTSPEKFKDTYDLFTKTFSGNVVGTATLTEALVPSLRKSPLPRVVFVSSRMGSLAMSLDESTPWHNLECTAYDASKAALNAVAINYVRKLKDVGAKVNVICPGLVATELSPGVESGTTPYVGAQRIVDMATVGKDGPTGTWSSNDVEKIPW